MNKRESQIDKAQKSLLPNLIPPEFAAMGKERLQQLTALQSEFFTTLQGLIAAGVMAAAAIIFAWGSDGSRNAFAAPTCPGVITPDKLACCPTGSTPNADNTCQLQNGGRSAACPVQQLTYLGKCCLAGATVQPDGICGVNGVPAQDCPLGQLNRGGLMCCPFGQAPEANGSCRSPACPGPITADRLGCCPAGSTATANDACQLQSRGQTASCPIDHLTFLGACCPPGSTVQPDGVTCRAKGSVVHACPLRQLGADEVTCCASGLVPQANGSCLRGRTGKSNRIHPL